MTITPEKHCFAGAAKSGKTLLAEDMIFEAGIVRRRGTIEEKIP